MQDSKISLSPSELELFCNAEVILTKNSIIQKTISLLQEVQEELVRQNVTFLSTPKISKGENYLGLPYIILDYPRISENGNMFFIRSMFWWGKFFSSTLQVAGSYKEQNLQKLQSAYDVLSSGYYFIGINDNPWLHHFEESNYKRIDGLSREAFFLLLEESSHIKIAAWWPLQEWNSAANTLIESWKLFIRLIT